MTMARDLILTLTILALVLIADNQPKPVKSVQVDYCEIDQLTAQKAFGVYPDGSPALDENGKQKWRWHFEWGKTFGPCSLQDKYFNV